MTICSTCKTEKSDEDFYVNSRSKTGRDKQCKTCKLDVQHTRYQREAELMRAKAREYAASHKDERREYNKAYHAKNKETLAEKKVAYRLVNKEVISAKMAEWNAKNVDWRREYNAAYYAKNREELRQYAVGYNALHAESKRLVASAWRRENPDKLRAQYERRKPEHRRYAMERRVIKDRASTAWDAEFDDLVLNEAYVLSVARERTTDITWHIDHIEPLRGKKVCGLHNAYNIQVVPSSYNLTKGAKQVETLWVHGGGLR